MAEGMAPLNQQVVEPDYWTRSDPVARVAEPSTSSPPHILERARRRDEVRRAVAADIIPRVVMQRRDRAVVEAITTGQAIDGDEVLRFARLLLRHEDEAVVMAHLLATQARGVSIAEIYLDLFQPAARHIGDLWADDRCTFVDVTLAVGTLQKMLRTFGPVFHKNGRPAEGGRQALLLPLPGDQHTFGLSMVAEFFRRAGWNVWNTPLASPEDIGEAVSGAWFALVGFSASTDSRLDELAVTIGLIRRRSCNPHLGVMVGGPIFVEHPDYVARVGADAMGEDAVAALARAEAFATRSAAP